MTYEEAVARLKSLIGNNDPERAHGEADDILLELIESQHKQKRKALSKAFDLIEKWYA